MNNCYKKLWCKLYMCPGDMAELLRWLTSVAWLLSGLISLSQWHIPGGCRFKSHWYMTGLHTLAQPWIIIKFSVHLRRPCLEFDLYKCSITITIYNKWFNKLLAYIWFVNCKIVFGTIINSDELINNTYFFISSMYHWYIWYWIRVMV